MSDNLCADAKTAGLAELYDRRADPSAPDLRREQRAVALERQSHMRQNRQHRINVREL
ncbi:hypothetical protein ABZZ47_02330 [Streptomyces sp. NPDC006465]|uniref:hypothetical protein n=1 Tax=Streptomyces sp. NPDC006465 TaxID=3157174 RepID=UPI0033B99247